MGVSAKAYYDMNRRPILDIKVFITAAGTIVSVNIFDASTLLL